MLKRILAILLAILLLPVSAMAVDWGNIKGDMRKLISKSGQWLEFDMIGQQIDNIAIFGNDEHNILVIEESNRLATFPSALFQPGGSYEGEPMFSAVEGLLHIQYTEDLWVMFVGSGHDYILSEAMFGDVSVVLSDDETHYLFTDASGQTAVLDQVITLKHFNIELFPKTLDEARHYNWMHASLDSGAHLLGETDSLMKYVSSLSKASVYTAPYSSKSLRAFNGHATVSFHGDVWLLKEWRNEYGDEYYLIRYDVRPGLQRIGFIRRDHVDGEGRTPWGDTDYLNARVVTTRKTYLTDDPLVSQTPVMKLASGSRLRCLGLYDANFAYVSTVDSLDRIVWGFVPLKDLTMLSAKIYDPDPEAMEQLVGSWWYTQGDGKMADLITLYDDGTFECAVLADSYTPGMYVPSGSWYVTKHDPAARLYCSEPEYEISFLCENGSVMVEGLGFTENMLHISDDEGVTSYKMVNMNE